MWQPSDRLADLMDEQKRIVGQPCPAFGWSDELVRANPNVSIAEGLTKAVELHGRGQIQTQWVFAILFLQWDRHYTAFRVTMIGLLSSKYAQHIALNFPTGPEEKAALRIALGDRLNRPDVAALVEGKL